jgi:hypothetical protein
LETVFTVKILSQILCTTEDTAMGLLTILFGNRNSEKYADSIIESVFKRYMLVVGDYPNAPNVAHLAVTWMGYFGWGKEIWADPYRSTALTMAVAIHSCIPAPDCGMALALMMLSKDKPQLAARYPKFEFRYGQLMTETLILYQAQNWQELNRRFNTHHAKFPPCSPFPNVQMVLEMILACGQPGSRGDIE